MNDNEAKADRILAWMSKRAKENYFGMSCGASGINGVRSDKFVEYLRKYHADQTGLISDIAEAPEGEDFVWLEVGLLNQIIASYMDVRVDWSTDKNRYTVVA